MRRSRFNSCFLLMGLMVPSVAMSKPATDRFTLGDYVPGDVWLYIHSAHNPENDWLDAEYQEVWDTLAATGIDKDIVSLIFSFVPEEKKEEYRGVMDKWRGLLKAVNCADLGAKEFVFAERMLSTEQGPMNLMGADYVFLMRGKEGSGETNFTALTTIFKEISQLHEKLKFHDEDRDGIKCVTLRITPEGAGGKAINFSLFRRDDIIGLVNSRALVHEVTALMRGESKTTSIVQSKRLKEALAQVPAAENEISFFDVQMFLGSVSDMMRNAVSAAGSPSEEGKKWLDLVAKIMNRVNGFDYVISTTETQDHQKLTHNVVRVQEGKQKSDLVRLLVNRKPFAKFDEFIPVEATEFSAEAFIDLEGLYKTVLDVIKTDVPDGDQLIEKWNGILAGAGFDPDKDLFAWWSGEMIKLTLPAAVVTPMGGADSVLMIRLKDGEIASAKINGWLDKLQNMMKEQGQPLMIMPAQVSAEGFKQVTYPPIMMFINPVVGVKGDWLMLSSSAAALNKCLETAAGKHPSIAENERFKREGLAAKQPVLSCSFTDTSKFGEELAGAVGMAGFVGGMITASMPNDAQSGQAKKAIQSVMQIVMKLGPVLQKLDFYSSEASMGTYDGELTIRKESVVTFKNPEPEKVKTADGKP